ncbi:uncharacterized protein FOMMEDRAFT_151321 [Fomitiporia mediterranea MF3/22]|uniref:uncharacterized protein n=1 Tax=Fomitiporia mediterranea (strain MF3/22) TaxID=694068 RepID=UPI00044095E3|nr:uncharacterized protein FOMMEDRAFT_151321 [Fomitiporia mediterranea MF3/22]EJD08458.1 hypothetical protein FOMMEDRAFT_151321 [Fomitiporia mediterranea MF3/22]
MHVDTDGAPNMLSTLTSAERPGKTLREDHISTDYALSLHDAQSFNLNNLCLQMIDLLGQAGHYCNNGLPTTSMFKFRDSPQVSQAARGLYFTSIREIRRITVHHIVFFPVSVPLVVILSDASWGKSRHLRTSDPLLQAHSRFSQKASNACIGKRTSESLAYTSRLKGSMLIQSSNATHGQLEPCVRTSQLLIGKQNLGASAPHRTLSWFRPDLEFTSSEWVETIEDTNSDQRWLNTGTPHTAIREDKRPEAWASPIAQANGHLVELTTCRTWSNRINYRLPPSAQINVKRSSGGHCAHKVRLILLAYPTNLFLSAPFLFPSFNQLILRSGFHGQLFAFLSPDLAHLLDPPLSLSMPLPMNFDTHTCKATPLSTRYRRAEAVIILRRIYATGACVVALGRRRT